MIEVKPKWLLQSPSAPTDAVRCRTCAVRLHRRLKDSSYDGAHLPCPLLMTSDRWEDRSLFVSRLFGDEELDEWYVAPLRRWFKGVAPSRPKRLITQVRNMQRQLDQKGPLGSNADDEQFRLAMTLRDCSVFLRVLRRPGGQAKVVAKIADLDKKNSAAKMDWWKKTELDLVKGGAYFAEYRVDVEQGRVVIAGTECHMEMERRRARRKSEAKERQLQGELRLREGMEEHHNRLIRECDLEKYVV